MIKVRIAPSPTGFLHIGTARSTLFNYVFARKFGGHFLLRIDDTDVLRSNRKFEEDIINGLSWLGFSWDSFFRQSERLSTYRMYLENLLKERKIFFCRHSIDELAKEREDQMRKKEAPRHVCSDREKNYSEGILRFKNNRTELIAFTDIIRGEISFNPAILGDFSVAKNLDSPLYNFSTVVDDGLEHITHVIRGEDHIPNTPKQILIQEALGLNRHQYAHLPLILGKDRSKLSKRHGATSIIQYKKNGYLPDAMVNFLGLLGWHPPEHIFKEEIFSLDDMITYFSLEHVQKSGAVFDPDKLLWLNSVYIRKTDTRSIADMAYSYLPSAWQEIAKKNNEWWNTIVALEQTRLNRLDEIGERVNYFFEEPSLRKDILMDTLKDTSRVLKHLSYVYDTISDFNEKKITLELLESKIMPYAEKEGKKEVLWPLRVALTGKRASPGLFEVALLLGKEKVLARIKKAQQVIES